MGTLTLVVATVKELGMDEVRLDNPMQHLHQTLQGHLKRRVPTTTCVTVAETLFGYELRVEICGACKRVGLARKSPRAAVLEMHRVVFLQSYGIKRILDECRFGAVQAVVGK